MLTAREEIREAVVIGEGDSPYILCVSLPDKVIDGALRVSFSRCSTKDEARYFVKTLKKAAETLLR